MTNRIHPGRAPLLTAYATLVYAFLYFPIAVLLIYSFNGRRRRLSSRHLTLDWYRQLFADSRYLGLRPQQLDSGGRSPSYSPLLWDFSRRWLSIAPISPASRSSAASFFYL